jgi:hypothetical protein
MDLFIIKSKKTGKYQKYVCIFLYLVYFHLYIIYAFVLFKHKLSRTISNTNKKYIN